MCANPVVTFNFNNGLVPSQLSEAGITLDADGLKVTAATKGQPFIGSVGQKLTIILYNKRFNWSFTKIGVCTIEIPDKAALDAAAKIPCALNDGKGSVSIGLTYALKRLSNKKEPW